MVDPSEPVVLVGAPVPALGTASGHLPSLLPRVQATATKNKRHGFCLIHALTYILLRRLSSQFRPEGSSTFSPLRLSTRVKKPNKPNCRLLAGSDEPAPCPFNE